MWCQVCQLRKNKVICFEARVYDGAQVKHTYSAMSEAGARSWLASQGVPFSKQPRFLTVIGG